MKVDVPVREISVTQTQLAEALGVTRSCVNQQINRGIVVLDTESDNGSVLLFESLKNYFSGKSKKAKFGDIDAMVVSQSALARALGLSQPRINQLIDEKIVVRDESSSDGKVLLFESIRNYYMNKSGKNGLAVNFNEEKALLMKAKRELAELKLAKAKDEVVNAADMEKVFTKMFTVLRTKLLSLPSTLALQLENKDHHEIYEILSAAMEETLLELSNFDFSALKSESGDE